MRLGVDPLTGMPIIRERPRVSVVSSGGGGGGGSTGGGGHVNSIQPGSNVTVDNTDPVNPVVNAVGAIAGGIVSAGGAAAVFAGQEGDNLRFRDLNSSDGSLNLSLNPDDNIEISIATPARQQYYSIEAADFTVTIQPNTDQTLITYGAITVTMPPAENNGNSYRFVNEGTDTVTIVPNGTDTIRGIASLSLPTLQAVTLTAYNSNWYATSGLTPTPDPAVWGGISGTLADQTDLLDALAAKASQDDMQSAYDQIGTLSSAVVAVEGVVANKADDTAVVHLTDTEVVTGKKDFTASSNDGSIRTNHITIYPNAGRSTSSSMFLNNNNGNVWEFFSNSGGQFGVYGNGEPFAIDWNCTTYHALNLRNNGVWTALPVVIENNNLELFNNGYGVIMKSPNGTKYKLSVNNDGTLSTALA